MAISFIGSAKGTDTATMPAHLTGDLIVIGAYRSGSTVAPNNVGGYTSVLTGSGTNWCRRIAYKFAASSSEVVGTWTNATDLIVHVYRGVAAINMLTSGNFITGSSIFYPSASITLQNNSTSWLMMFGAVLSTASNIENSPTGFTARENRVGSALEISTFDKVGPNPDGNGPSVSLGVTAERNAIAIELIESPRAVTLPSRSYTIGAANTPIIRPSPITFIGAASGTNTATLPAHQAGDLIVVASWNGAGSALPSTPTDFISFVAASLNGIGYRVSYKIALSAGETISTMSNSTVCVVGIYRGTKQVNPIGVSAALNGTGSSINYPAVSMTDVSGGSWIVAAATTYAVSTSTIETPPPLMVLREDGVGASTEVVLFDTNESVGVWGARTVTVGSGPQWRTVVFEILAPVNTNMVADAASYAIGAADVNIVRSYTITADPASYMLSGADTPFIRSLLMTAAPAAYAIGAADVTFDIGRFIIATPASYAIGAADVGFVRSLIMSGAPASYAISGADAVFVRSLVMSGAAASYAISAADVSWEKGYVITATPASYAIGASDVAFVRSLIMSGEAAGYLVGASDVAMVRGYSIFADAASFAVSAADVALEIELSGLPINVFRSGAWVEGRLKIWRDGDWGKPTVKRYHDGDWEEL